ncbi:MAG: hypothetical protein AAF125_15420, partial [Chloroflexota bacterium]
RSRNGKLMPPRFGILKYVVEAAEKGEMKDLTIVPISIYYDLIAELGDYAKEQTGATKRKESFAWFTGYLRSLRKPLGRISFGLGDPVVVDTTSERFVAARDEGQSSLSIELQKLAFEASVNVNAVTPITPSSLICLALTGAAPQALTAEELVSHVWRLRDWALARGCAMTDELKTVTEDDSLDAAYAPGGSSSGSADETAGAETPESPPERAHREGLPRYRLSFWEWVQARLFGVDVLADQEQRLVSLTYAIERHADAPVNYVLRGELYLRARKYEKAAVDFQRALELAQAEYEASDWGVNAQSYRDRALQGLKDVSRLR